MQLCACQKRHVPKTALFTCVLSTIHCQSCSLLRKHLVSTPSVAISGTHLVPQTQHSGAAWHDFRCWVLPAFEVVTPVKAVRLLRRYALLIVASLDNNILQKSAAFSALTAARFLKTSVPILQTTRYHIPEDHNLTCLVV